MDRSERKQKILSIIWVVIAAAQLWLWGAEWALHSCAGCEPKPAPDKGE